MIKRGGPPTRAHGAPGHAGGAGTPAIPDKLYFRIGEVADLCRVPTYVLRFWQTEFAQLRPSKSGTGQRLYRKRDVEMALRIKRLLHEEGYTIAGARGVLAEEGALPSRLRLQTDLPLSSAASGEPDASPGASVDASGEAALASLRQVRAELRELLGMLERKPVAKPEARQPAPLLFGGETPDA